MRLLRIEVRQDWREFEQHLHQEYANLWRSVQVIVLVSTFILLVLTVIDLPRPVATLAGMSLSSFPFLSYSLWKLFRNRPKNLWLALSGGTIVVAAVALAGMTYPQVPDPGGSTLWSSIHTTWVVLLPLITWPWVSVLFVHYRAQDLLMGPNRVRGALYGMSGLVLGAALGLHFLLLSNTIARGGANGLTSGQFTLWVFFFYAALAAPAEEFLLRGLTYEVLNEGLKYSFWKSSFHIAALNVLIYAFQALFIPGGVWGFLLLIYRFAFALLACYLRDRLAILFPGIVASVVFNTLLSLVVRW